MWQDFIAVVIVAAEAYEGRVSNRLFALKLVLLWFIFVSPVLHAHVHLWMRTAALQYTATVFFIIT